MLFLNEVYKRSYPIEVLPAWMQKVSALLPLTYSVRALRAVGLAGAGWEHVQSDAVVLVMFSVLFVTLGLAAFKVVERLGQRAGTLSHY